MRVYWIFEMECLQGELMQMEDAKETIKCNAAIT